MQPVTEDRLELEISRNTLHEREYSDKRFAAKKYEKLINAVLVTLAGFVLFGIGKFVVDRSIQGTNAPANVENAYDA